MNDFGYAVAVDKDGATLIMNSPDGRLFELPLDRQDITNIVAMLQHALTLHDKYAEEQGDAG